MQKKIGLALVLGLMMALLVCGTALAAYVVSCPRCSSKEKISVIGVRKNSDNKTHTLMFSHRGCYDGGGLHGDYLFEKSYPHEGGTATCTSRAVCTGCMTYYGNKDPNNHKLQHYAAQAATCTAIGWDAYDACTRCDYSAYTQTAALGHDYSGVDDVCTRIGCGAVADDLLGSGPGGICAVHDYQAAVASPTCLKKGYTTHTCTNCGDTYKDSYTAARPHWYKLWTGNGDGTHSASCRRGGCKHTGMAECALYEVAVGEAVLNVCPVCGMLGEHQMLAFEKPTINNVSKNAIPERGELIARGLETPVDGVLYVLTVAYEFAGKVEAFNGKVKVTIPINLADAFKLVRVDRTDAADTTERTETRTEIPFTYENSKLTFETDTVGLFLLLPV